MVTVWLLHRLLPISLEVLEEVIEKRRLKSYFQMCKYILEGVIQKADYKNNGSIYPSLNKVYKDSVRKLIRKKKIIKLFK
jgi:hypothetical protein